MLTALIVLVGLFGLLLVEVPLAFAMGLMGVLGMSLIVGVRPALDMVGQVAVDTVMNYNFSILPQFVLMGSLIARSGLAQDLYRASNTLVGHFRGGLAMATVIACGGFAAVSGSSLACAATMSRVCVPSMRRFGYSPSLAAGTVAAGGTLGILIPPSIAMAIYAFITDTDLGRLLIAGILPGLLMILAFCTVIATLTRIRPELGPPAARASWRTRLGALTGVIDMVGLFLLIFGSIYFGIVTPTEAAGVGAFGALAFALKRRALSWPVFGEILAEAARTTAMLFFVLIGAIILTNFMTVSGFTRTLEAWVGHLQLPPLAVLLVIGVVYLILGCLLEQTAMMLLTIPIFFPVVTKLGFDPIWFGVFVVVMVEVGLITPPIGMNVFVVKAVLPELPTRDIFRGILPFLAAQLVVATLLAAFPALALVLTRYMR